MLQLLQRGDRSAQEPATRMGHILFFPCLFWEYIFWQLGRDNIGCMMPFLAWCRRTLNFLIVCAVSESWSWWWSFFPQAPAQSIFQRRATTFVYIVLYFHFLYISHINQLHLHDIHLLPVMYISYIIYIILHSRCYTGVRAPKLLHRSSYIKEPFGKGLDGLPGGLTGASEGLEGGLRGLRRLQGGLRRASRGLEKGFRGAWRCLAWRGASRGLQGGLRRASRGLQGGVEKGFKWGLKEASPSRGLEKGFKGASRGLEKASRGLDGEGFEGGLKGAWEGLQEGSEGLQRASRGFISAWRGLQALLIFVLPPGEGPFKFALKGTFEGGGSDSAPAMSICTFTWNSLHSRIQESGARRVGRWLLFAVERIVALLEPLLHMWENLHFW